MKQTHTAVFVLIQNHTVLVEKRKMTKSTYPGALMFPGGRIEPNELPEQALVREVQEELGLNVLSFESLGIKTHTDEYHHLTAHYFLITTWTGKLENHEAEELIWLPFNQADELHFDIDREILKTIRTQRV